MRVLYIGQYKEGSTSRMRGEILKKILNPTVFEVINTNVPIDKCVRWQKSLAYRLKMGPCIRKINKYISGLISNVKYDLVWVDKGVFIKETTTRKIKESALYTIHFTPDPAFTYHKSTHFYKSIKYYDMLITTKSYEMNNFRNYIKGNQKLIYVTQGFDLTLHKNTVKFSEREFAIGFVGHHEREREITLQLLLNHNYQLYLAGIGWESFVSKNKLSPYLKYLGKGVFGKDYAAILNTCKLALGSVSKWVPEKHTTRTFEIPACGTVLLTEKNIEINSFFTEQEVIFYEDDKQLLSQLNWYKNNPELLEKISENGYKKVHASGFDYESIMSKVLEDKFRIYNTKTN